MVRRRWLLILRAEDEPDGPGLTYDLWLYDLDGPWPRRFHRYTDVEALYAALFADQHPGADER